MKQEIYYITSLIVGSATTIATVTISILALLEAKKARRISLEPILCPRIICIDDFYYFELLNSGKGQIFDLQIKSKDDIIRNMKTHKIKSLPTQNNVRLLISTKQAVFNLTNKIVKVSINYRDQFDQKHVLTDLTYDFETIS